MSPALFDVIKVIRAVFPFHAALDAMSGALDASGPGLGGPILHLGDPGRRIRGAGADRAAAIRVGVRSAPNWLSVSAEEVTDGNS